MFMVEKKTVLFGGTFDPVHLGHITVTANASEQIGAEKTIFIPAKCSPLKTSSPIASDKERLEMIVLAIEDFENFQVSDYELKKDGTCFTLETVRQFQMQCGNDTSIYWLVGADSVEELWRWHGITDLIDESNLSLMYRACDSKPDFSGFADLWGMERVKKLQKNVIKTPFVDISSTQIRKRLAAGEDVSEMLNPSVAEYIHERGLYE